MALSFIGQATGTTSATLPSHQIGDLIIGFAFRDGSTTAPTLPSGWTSLQSGGANTCAIRLAYKIAQTASETSGTWTSATSLIVHVYRSTGRIGPGASAVGGGSSTTVTYPALTLTETDRSSWVAGFAGHVSVDTNLQNAPSGMTARSTVVDATDEASGHDSSGPVGAWAATNVSVGGTSGGWRACTVEILEDPAVAYVGSATYYDATVSAPTGTQIGDLLIVTAIAQTSGFAAPAGWTPLATAFYMGDTGFDFWQIQCWRIRQSGDTTYTFTSNVGAIIQAYRNTHQTAPIVHHGATEHQTSTTITLPTLGAPLAAGAAAAYHYVGCYHDTFLPPTNYTETTDPADDTTSGYRLTLVPGSTTGGNITADGQSGSVSGGSMHAVIRSNKGERTGDVPPTTLLREAA